MTVVLLPPKRDPALDELQRSCPHVTVEGGEESRKWQIRGLRNGEVVIRAKSGQLSVAVKKFREAYYLMESKGMLK